MKASTKFKKEFFNLAGFEEFCESDQKIIRKIATALAGILACNSGSHYPLLFELLHKIIAGASRQAAWNRPSDGEAEVGEIYLKAVDHATECACNGFMYFARDCGAHAYYSNTHGLNCFQTTLQDLLIIAKHAEKDAKENFPLKLDKDTIEGNIDSYMRSTIVFKNYYFLTFGTSG